MYLYYFQLLIFIWIIITIITKFKFKCKYVNNFNLDNAFKIYYAPSSLILFPKLNIYSNYNCYNY